MRHRHGHWIPLIDERRNYAQEHDQRVALAFYKQPTAAGLGLQYAPECDSEIFCDSTKFAIYVICRERGVEPVFAAMRACRRAPAAKGMDRHFNEGARRRMNAMGAKHLDKIVRQARQAGISTQGKYYVGGLGRYNDPGAWCSTVDDILQTARQRNLEVTGVVNYAAHETPPPKKIKLAPDILKRYERAYLKQDPALAERVKKNPKARTELREKIIAQHARTSVER